MCERISVYKYIFKLKKCICLTSESKHPLVQTRLRKNTCIIIIIIIIIIKKQPNSNTAQFRHFSTFVLAGVFKRD